MDIYAVLITLIALAAGVGIGRLSSKSQLIQLQATQAALQEQLDRTHNDATERGALQAMIEPLRQEVERLTKQANDAATEQAKAAGTLSEQLRNVQTGYTTLESSTAAIKNALLRGQTRGQWGEMQLELLLSSAGLLESVHYERQTTRSSGDDNVRPDIFIKLPDSTAVPIDAKFPFEAYWNSLDTSDLEQAHALRQKHAADVWAHAQALAKKKYVDLESGPNFVVLFLPLESILSAALESDPQLLEKCFAKNVVLASPTTMMGLLRTVAFGWQRNDLAANAREIGAVASGLLERLGKLIEEVTKLRKGLESGVRAYNSFASALDNSVLRDARKLKDLGVSISHELEGPEAIAIPLRGAESGEAALEGR